MSENFQKAAFGAGCFWGVEETFRAIPGVAKVQVGYCGGHTENPTYKEVCSDQTGHAETVEVTYDPAAVSYEKLLEAFFSSHNPTQVNRQGPDYGSQYRSVIFCYSEDQKKQAEAMKASLNASGRFPAPIATSIEPEAAFWPAEEYHQQYLKKNGLTSCHI